MRGTDKAIISCAVTGSIHTPSMSPYLPITPNDIAEQAVAAAEAGASILHLHARDPGTGEPTPSPDIFMEFLPRIKQSTDAVVNITTGGSHTMTLDERIAAAKRAEPELCSLNMGAMIFDFSAAGKRIDKWRFDWEKSYVDGAYDRVMYNTNHYIERILNEVGDAYGTRFEFECYDIGHLYTLAHFADRGLAKPPFFIQCIFGILGGVGADLRNLSHAITIADSLFGDDYHLSVFAAGKNQFKFCTQAAMSGGHVRVGLEDSLYIGKGELAKSNADQVAKISRILSELSIEVASPAEARAILDLKGGDNVAF
ncbi:MAG: 3-keto-5-aminohexanoate cleavage protein [Pseudomonadota bacterium]